MSHFREPRVSFIELEGSLDITLSSLSGASGPGETQEPQQGEDRTSSIAT
jgi:hypothetical protein